MTALLLGSIGTLVDTSERQRAAFNQAFAAHGLDWHWSREDYLDLLRTSGGADRVAGYAARRGEQVDAAAVHATKSTLFQDGLLAEPVGPRPGLLDTLAAARGDGAPVALVTTTSAANVDAVLASLDLDRADFDLVVDAGTAGAPKPDPAAYVLALTALGRQPGDCVAVEDNLDGLAAATAAGVRCVAFPGPNNEGHDFTGAHARVDALDYAALRDVAAS